MVTFSFIKDIFVLFLLQNFKSNTPLASVIMNPTFNKTSGISWRSVLLVEETGIPGEKHRPVASRLQTLSHKVVSSTPRHERDSN